VVEMIPTGRSISVTGRLSSLDHRDRQALIASSKGGRRQSADHPRERRSHWQSRDDGPERGLIRSKTVRSFQEVMRRQAGGGSAYESAEL
jgi:hypothetical protein